MSRELDGLKLFPVTTNSANPMPAVNPPSTELVEVTLHLSPEQLRVFAAVGTMAGNNSIATAEEVILALACSRLEQEHGEDKDYVGLELAASFWTFVARHEPPVDSYWESGKRMRELNKVKVT